MAFRKLGEFIKLVDIRNSGGNISNLLGVSISKEFMPSVANIIGTDLTKYKIISKGQFACSLMQVSRDGGIAISLYKNAESAIMSPAYFIFEVSNNQLNSDYLELIFNTSEFDRAATFYAVGGVRGTLTWDDFCKMEINVPDIAEQERVVKIYNVINNRIKILNALNKNLEEQAQTIFKHWFIDNEEHLRQNCRLDEYFDISIGKTPPRIESNWFSTDLKDIPWVSITDMGHSGLYINNTSEKLTFEAIKKFNIKMIPVNTVILSFKFTVGRVVITNRKMVTNEAIAHFKTNKNYIVEYLYFYLKNFNYNTAGNTSSIANAINSKIVKSIPFIIPEDDELMKFHEIVNPMFEVIRNNCLQNEKLAELRDLLLPKLLS